MYIDIYRLAMYYVFWVVTTRKPDCGYGVKKAMKKGVSRRSISGTLSLATVYLLITAIVVLSGCDLIPSSTGTSPTPGSSSTPDSAQASLV